MRAAIFLLSFLFPALIIAQQSPVQWKLNAKKINEKQYELSVNATIADDWYVYAENNMELGLEAVKLSTDNDKVVITELKNSSTAISANDKIFQTAVKVWKGEVTFNSIIEFKEQVPASLPVTVNAYAANGDEFIPVPQTIEVTLEGGFTKTGMPEIPAEKRTPITNCGEEINTNSSLWNIFWKGLLGGFIALLMPCIFPMLPVTVSFFMNKAKTKKQGVINAIMYGFFIFLIYILFSVPFHIAGGNNPQLFNMISTDMWVNLVFFMVFLVFALSLFGLFELKLPGGLANTAGKKSNVSSIGGIFFMALTLAIVSFSCTGPILGALLVNSASSAGSAWSLTAGLAGFGVALALPFGLFAMFPQWLKKLPKSGGWMEVLKKSLAFVELALAFKFLSNADLVQHWGLLKREVFIGIWLLITIAMGLYLLGVFDKKKIIVSSLVNADHLRPVKPKLSKGRWIAGILILLFAAYLAPGLTNTKYANLTLVSGFPPPLSYSVFGKSNMHGKGVEPDVVNDYDKALALSKQTGKPLLVDFTGWACVNCRKMEENVWTEKQVGDLMRNNFIVVSLYVDDREKLDPENRFNYEGRYVKTVGDKWGLFQEKNFKSSSQPQYVILTPDEQVVNHPVGATKVERYRDWLECGLNAYKQKQLAKK